MIHKEDQNILIDWTVICNFKDIAKVKDHALVLVPDETESPRAGWSEAFKKMAQAGDDALLDETLFELESDRTCWK